MSSEAGDRHDEVEVAAELVDLPHVAGDEGSALGLGQISLRNGAGSIGGEQGAEGRVLLEPVQQAVDRVAAHDSRHSIAARLMRGSSPKNRTSARAGVTAPISTIQLRNSWLPLLCSSSAESSRSGSCSPTSIQWTSLRSKTVSVSPTRASESSGKCDRPPVAMIPTFHGAAAITRARCWPKAKQ